MASYEQTLRLFARSVWERHDIENADEVKELHIRSYIIDLQSRGKYTFCADERSTKQNHPANRRDYRQKLSNITINNYLRKDRYRESPFIFPVRHTGRMLKDSNYETNFAKYIKRAVGALVISQEIRVQFIYVFPVLQ